MTGNGDATRLDMYFCPLYSGSSGNALFCQYGNTRLLIDAGKSGKTIEDALADILCEVDRANRLAAKAAFGDREALREYVESDPALDGLDRLYCMDVVNALIRMHEDVLTRF